MEHSQTASRFDCIKLSNQLCFPLYACSKEVIRQFTEDNFYALDFTLDEIRPTYEFTESCQGSCPQAIEAFLEGDSFEDVILKALSIGGDSDTIAAMAGAIAEAYYGIPEELKQKAFDILQDTKLRRMVYHNSVLRGTAEDFSRWIARREGGKI